MKVVRLYISGLHLTITEEDLKELFKPFGQIKKVQIARYKEPKYQTFCRGFAHFEINFPSQDSQNHCLHMYDGCKWKSRRIQLEIAHPNFKDRRLAERREDHLSIPYSSSRKKVVEVQSFSSDRLWIAGRARNTRIEVYCGSSIKFDCSDEQKTSYTKSHLGINFSNFSLSNEARNTEIMRASTPRKLGRGPVRARDSDFIDFKQETFTKSVKKKSYYSDNKRISISSDFFRQ